MRLSVILKSLAYYYKGAEEAQKIILNCALVAAAAAAVGGTIPLLAIPGMITACVGAVWAMYIKLCKHFNISIKDHILRVLASAALSNIATNLVGAFAVMLASTFIPVGSVFGSALLTFCSVYLAGLIFMKMLLSMAQEGVYGAALEHLSEDDLKKAIKKEHVNKEDLNNAKEEYKNNKDNKDYQDNDDEA